MPCLLGGVFGMPDFNLSPDRRVTKVDVSVPIDIHTLHIAYVHKAILL